MRATSDDFLLHLAAAARGVGVGLVLVAWASVLGSEARLNSDLLIYLEIGSAVVGIALSQWFTSLPNEQGDKLQVRQASRRQPQQKQRGNGQEREPVQPERDHRQDANDAVRP